MNALYEELLGFLGISLRKAASGDLTGHYELVKADSHLNRMRISRSLGEYLHKRNRMVIEK